MEQPIIENPIMEEPIVDQSTINETHARNYIEDQDKIDEIDPFECKLLVVIQSDGEFGLGYAIQYYDIKCHTLIKSNKIESRTTTFTAEITHHYTVNEIIVQIISFT
ncbi:hypothetical protein L2E82_49412 [Cichorium intybus]|uniref:Uncharacterized protein n=1 Tax=Cichorium intybus TaxID=13427 RepID=A0ACB8Z0T7_CICIN|nr:hypothetical protein L2E82_49412 [Cichorium intybus]